jgi:hypothetical protein
MNALKSGVYAQAEIIAGENVADLQTLTDEYIARFCPTTPEERGLVDTLIRDDWRLRRLARAEAQLWEFSMRHTDLLDKQNPLGHVLTVNDEGFTRLQRLINQIERSSQNALRALERIQSGRDLEPIASEAAAPQPENCPESGPQPEQTKTASPEIGFVPPIPQPEEFMNGDEPRGDGPKPLSGVGRMTRKSGSRKRRFVGEPGSSRPQARTALAGESFENSQSAC